MQPTNLNNINNADFVHRYLYLYFKSVPFENSLIIWFPRGSIGTSGLLEINSPSKESARS